MTVIENCKRAPFLTAPFRDSSRCRCFHRSFAALRGGCGRRRTHAVLRCFGPGNLRRRSLQRAHAGRKAGETRPCCSGCGARVTGRRLGNEVSVTEPAGRGPWLYPGSLGLRRFLRGAGSVASLPFSDDRRSPGGDGHEPVQAHRHACSHQRTFAERLIPGFMPRNCLRARSKVYGRFMTDNATQTAHLDTGTSAL